MYQQQVPQPRDEQGWSNSGPNYEDGYGSNLQQSDQLADAIARRLQSQTPVNMQIPSMQFGQPASHGGVSAGMRLALAIVSVGTLMPIVGIILGILGPSFGALVGLGIACAAILGINFMFNFHR